MSNASGSTEMERKEIVVIGGGAIGIATALWLRRDGYDVTLLEPGSLAGETSYGNSSTFGVYACMPIAQPGIWGAIPSLLFSKDSPLVVKWSRLPKLMPWLIRFLAQCTPSKTLHNAELLAQLLSRTYSGYEPLLEACPEAVGLMNKRGCLYSYSTDLGLRRAKGEIEMRDRLGVEQKVLTAKQVEELEPTMVGKTKGGVLFSEACHLSDVQQFLQALAAPLVAENRVLKERVARLASKASGVTITCVSGRRFVADRVVVAAGAWSGELAAQIGDYIPLETERGYHIEFDLDRKLFNRPTCNVETAFYMTPLSGGRLRCGGTVELGSLRDPLNPKRTKYIEDRVRALIGIEEPVAREWVGFRPTVPDFVPVIGPSSADPRVIYAFGHQHVGVTLAGITGELVAGCINGTAPSWLKSYSPSRFN